MTFYYNSADKNCKSVTGGIKSGEPFTLTVFTKYYKSCKLILHMDGGDEQAFQMQENGGGFTLNLTIDDVGLYWYHFELGGELIGKGDFCLAEMQSHIKKYHIVIYGKNFKVPDLLKGGLIYQIFPDRFNKSGDVVVGKGKVLKNWKDMPDYLPNNKNIVENKDFFGGNLRGIIEKLPYLKSLGITAIYLNPIFKAFSNHRYDTGDFLKIDEMLGAEKDFDRLIEKANISGIKIILDGVFNHTGDDSVYFNKYGNYHSLGAYQSKLSEFYKWYKFEKYPDKYKCWWGIKILPELDKSNKSYINFMTGKGGVIDFWMNKGIGGFRLDVADELPNSFLARVRKAVKRNDKNAAIIGEVWEDASTKIAYGERKNYFLGDSLDGVMNYPLKYAIIDTVINKDTAHFKRAMLSLIDNYPKQALDSCMNFLGTHDTARIITELGGKKFKSKKQMASDVLTKTEYLNAVKLLKYAALFLYTAVGVPSIYYGDEVGLQGHKDPFNRQCYPWDNIDEQLLSYFKKLGEIRKNQVFISGDYSELYCDKTCIVYERREGDRAVYIAVNMGSYGYNLNFKGRLIDLLSAKKYNNNVLLKEFSTMVLADI